MHADILSMSIQCASVMNDIAHRSDISLIWIYLQFDDGIHRVVVLKKPNYFPFAPELLIIDPFVTVDQRKDIAEGLVDV